jgi:hypothetical protein
VESGVQRRFDSCRESFVSPPAPFNPPCKLSHSRHDPIVIWDRDYMKNPSDLTEAEESDSSSSAPQPFNLFAGLPEEQLPASTVQTKVPTNLVPSAETQRTANMVSSRSTAMYWAIALFALLIAVLLVVL